MIKYGKTGRCAGQNIWFPFENSELKEIMVQMQFANVIEKIRLFDEHSRLLRIDGCGCLEVKKWEWR
jgi:hypothetical protein